MTKNPYRKYHRRKVLRLIRLRKQTALYRLRGWAKIGRSWVKADSQEFRSHIARLRSRRNH